MIAEKTLIDGYFQVFLQCPRSMRRKPGEAPAEDSPAIATGSLT